MKGQSRYLHSQGVFNVRHCSTNGVAPKASLHIACFNGSDMDLPVCHSHECRQRRSSTSRRAILSRATAKGRLPELIPSEAWPQARLGGSRDRTKLLPGWDAPVDLALRQDRRAKLRGVSVQ